MTFYFLTLLSKKHDMKYIITFCFFFLVALQINAQYLSTITDIFDAPEQSVVDAAGNVYIADTDLNQIFIYKPDGTISVYAGNGVGTHADGPRLSASFNYPIGLAIDDNENIYVSEGLNYDIRKITPDGIVSTITGGTQGYVDGNFSVAQFTGLGYMTWYDNALFITDGTNDVIRKIDFTTQTVSTYAGSGIEGDLDGNYDVARFNRPRAVLSDGLGNIYVADSENHKVKKIDANQVVTTFAGTGNAGHIDGETFNAEFNGLKGMTIDVDGNIYIADRLNYVVRKISTGGIVSTVIGLPGVPGNVDGFPNVAKIGRPVNVTYAEPDLILSDWGNKTLRYIELATGNEDFDQDGYIASEDCDDLNPNANPGQTEIPYNGFDDDCDPSTLDDDLDQDGYNNVDDCDDLNADANPGQTEIPYNGLDDDCDNTTLDDDLDQDGYGIIDDCDDNNPNVNPGQTEIPWTGIDEDCDESTLDDDIDQDGFGLDFDCNDTDPNINPDQTEIPYNGLDDDCDDETLDDDLDQDGFGIDEDCDDNNPDVNPDQDEIPGNGLNDDCDASTPDNDADQDGYGDDIDCDDNDPNVNPGQTEIPYNSIDDDCDPTTLDDDFDQDGYASAEDCDDDNPNINPGQEEIPYNDIDDDCNEATLDDDVDQDGFLLADDCDDMNPAVNPDQTEIPYNGLDDDCDASTLDDDLDQDGFVAELDCDDTNNEINPDAQEIPYNGIDDDCDPQSLDDDLDQDGFNLADDCDDTNSEINPNAVEIPGNDIDENCDGLVVGIHNLNGVKIDIYPNPAQNIVFVQTDKFLNFTLEIYNLDGKLILQKDNITTVDVSNYQVGSYVFIIKNKLTQELIIDKIQIY